MMERNDIVVGMGEVLWDMLPEGRRPGGAPANFVYHVSQLGLNGCVVSAVGRDMPGREIVEKLAEKGIDGIINEVEYPTGSVEIEVDEKGVPKYEIKENVAWDNIPFTAEMKALAERARVVCFGSLAQRSEVSRETIRRFIEVMPRGEGTMVVFDINLRQSFYEKETVERSLELCNVLKINDEELEVVARMFGYEGEESIGVCRALMERYNIEMVILTCGAAGSYVVTGEGVTYEETPKVEVVDTVGAGDSFTAAFVASIIKGRTVAEAHRCATRTAAYVCSRRGAMPEMEK